jgi:hypothetical protein
VFRYLQELHRVRTPPVLDVGRYDWALRLDTLPRHAVVQRGFALGSETDDANRGFILRVARPATETECPRPSVLFENWLEAGWEQPGVDPAVLATMHHPATNRDEGFEDNEERVLAFESWLEKRWKWEDGESHVVAAARLFSELFTLWGKFERESEKLQLFLGDGILVASHEGEVVRHPLLLQRVQLEFDASKPQFTVMETGDPPTLYAPLLRYLEVDPKRLTQFKDRIASEEISPLGGSRTSELLKDLVQTCWKDGVYSEEPHDVGRAAWPYVYRQPAFYLGNRNQGFADTIERYIDILPRFHELPESLLRIVGIETGRGTGSHEPAEMLVTRDANREQRRVIARLDETGAVLVQGPPGTGKSHTIANLIGHLLAHGKTILVTSHASKALRIVREKVARPLQSLCVSLLDSDEESTKQLEESITGILNYLSSTTQAKLDKDIARLTEAREALRAERDALSVRLHAAVKAEHDELEILGERMTVSEAAKRASRSAGVHEWIPGPLHGVVALSIDEINELYRLNAAVSAADEQLLVAERPAVSDLPPPADLATLLDELKRSEHARPAASAKLWLDDNQTTESLAQLDALVRETIATLSDGSPWVTECLAAGRAGGPEKKSWETLVEEVRRVALEVPLRDELILTHGPVIESTTPLAELVETCGEIIAHLEAGKKLGRMSLMFKSSWNELIAASKVNGATPTTIDHFRAILAALEVDALRDGLVRRWDRQLDGLGAPTSAELGRKPEKKALEIVARIASALRWHDETWSHCLETFAANGIAWPRLLEQVPAGDETTRLRAALDHLGPILAERAQHHRTRDLASVREQWIDRLKGFSTQSAAYPLVKQLRNAIRSADYDTYVDAHTKLREVEGLADAVARRGELLRRLEASAPAWTAALAKRKPPHDAGDPPGSIDEALAHRIREQTLAEMHAVDLEELMAQLARATQKLQETTGRYVEALAWRAQFGRTALKQQQALGGWLALQKKIGKGTGKQVGRLKEEARRALIECRQAVPVWIMPLSRVVESFDIATAMFDVVIIDEASQSDVLGLVAFAMGKEIAVVGDHEQVSPYAVGTKSETIQGLIDEMLKDIPNKQLYDGRTSVYDLARQSFGGTIRLLEHFRCVPNIIQFSNDLCYSGEVRPLREAAAGKIEPHLVAVRVDGGTAVDRVNQKEAEVVASLVSAMCRFPEYDDCTIGVISMVGTENALLIDSILRGRLTVSEYSKRRLLCGNASQFQGDERDIMLLSMVDSPSELALPVRQRDEARKVFNVAASRARDQLWVVHSLDPGRDLKPGDLRLRLIQHVETATANKPAEIDLSSFLHDSELQGELCRILDGEGYRVVPRYAVGAHAIDIVVQGANNARVGILCDGGRAIQGDELGGLLEHQMILERLGWRLIRIRSSEFFRDPKRELERVRRRLGARGIKPIERAAPPAKAKGKPKPAEPTPASLHERVIQRAESIRSRWHTAIPRTASVPAAEQPATEVRGRGRRDRVR